jgi:hypothetical protein
VLPRGGLFSTAPELARFAMAVMHGGRIGGAAVIPAGAVDRVLAPGPVRWADSSPSRYGLGMRRVERFGHGEVGHYGGGGGYGSLVRMVPDAKVAVVLLANRGNALLDRSADLILSRLLNASEPVAPAAGPLAKSGSGFAGVYANAARMTLEFADEGGRLVLRDDGESIPLHELGPRSVGILTPDGKVEARFDFGVGARSGRPYVSFLSRAFLLRAD